MMTEPATCRSMWPVAASDGRNGRQLLHVGLAGRTTASKEGTCDNGLSMAAGSPHRVSSVISDNWKFFQAFLRSPRIVASVIPSSSPAVRRVVRTADPAAANVVVELGGGTGCMTRALLEAMSPEGRLLVIERMAEFIPALGRIADERLQVVHGCASAIRAELAACGHPQADVIISGIPFSTLPRVLAAEIAREVHRALRPGGMFIAYQFNDRVADYTRPLMGAPEIEFVLYNVPPVRLFTWRKAVPAFEESRLAGMGA